jgi:hypothetical protein
MSNPWDIRGPSPTGDESEEAMFVAVGRALSNWEHLEEDLADLFSFLVGSQELVHDAGDPASRVYGVVPTFNIRADMLDAAANVFFMNNPSAMLQREYKDSIAQCRRYAARRNEIAHGTSEFQGDRSYFLVPGYYNLRKNIDDGTPRYRYCSTEIQYYAERFAELASRIQKLFSDLPKERV